MEISNRAEALVSQVNQLITLPAIYFEIRRIIESPSSDIIDIAKAISTDVALTAALLRIVNSPIYAQSRPVETVTRAVSMLGLKQIHDLCLASCVASTFAKTHPKLMDVERFWSESLLRATCARSLALKCGILDIERLFIIGLLCDIGHMVMFMRIPEAMSKLFALRDTSAEPIHLIERKHLECDYAEIGGVLLRCWNLPPGIYHPIEQHTDPRADLPNAMETALLHLISCALQARKTRDDIINLTHQDAWNLVGLSPIDVTNALEEGLESSKSMLNIFLEKKAA